MKKRILFLGFLLTVFGLRIDAQTLKNIHRHNQPVLRIPTHLIDKVETAEVNGAQVLQVRQLNGYVSEIPLAQIDSITHSEGEAVDPAQLGNLRTASVMGVVTGPTGAPERNAIVRSPYGGEETRTDPNGVFFLNNILVYDKLGYITITKPGFHQGSRSFLPLETGSSRVNVQLLPMTQSGTFSASSGGIVTSGLLQLNFPANAITLNGQPYTGTVRVYAASLDPTSSSMFDQMPGELLGGMNDSLRLLRSFGMASIELRDANMNELQLADSTFATLTFSIPSSLQAEAPQSIDWWSFDETFGYWKHEGAAVRQGSQYLGQASHFSWWNCDVPENFNDLFGSVNTPVGIPISDAFINVISPTMGTAVAYTNSEGLFTGRVPKNQQLTLNAFLACTTTNNWVLVHSETLYSQSQVLSSTVIASLDGYYPISGIVVNCENQPVESGYVTLGPQVYMTNEASQFTIQTCATGEYEIRGFDITAPESTKVSEITTVQVDIQGVDAGVLQTCLEIFGTVADIDGNIYPTVLIGNQWWMAENLRSITYANGESIPNVSDSTSWGQLSSGAWCNFNNSEANDEEFGKMYNWYSVADPRNVCPTDWHVPTVAEWTALTDYLGGQAVAGGKMKTTTSWQNVVTNGTNESGFSALPGGSRNGYSGTFYSIGYYGYWWSSSEGNLNTAWFYHLMNISNDIWSDDNAKKEGYSIRCIRY
jgi:uncharacterized protein (TIGR02145 family)